MQDSLLREVNDDVRADQIARLWMRYRAYLVVLVIAILIATAGESFWNHYREQRGGALLLQFSTAQQQLEQGHAADAAKGFAIIAQHTDGDLHSLAQLWQARALSKTPAKDEANDILKQITATNHGLWGDLACLRLASLDAKEASCLDAKTNSPLAAERAQWAAANAWAAGDSDQASTILNKLAADPETPQATRANAERWLAILPPAKKTGK